MTLIGDLLVAHVVNGDADLVMVHGGDICRQPSLRGWRDVDDVSPKNRISLYLLVLRYATLLDRTPSTRIAFDRDIPRYRTWAREAVNEPK